MNTKIKLALSFLISTCSVFSEVPKNKDTDYYKYNVKCIQDSLEEIETFIGEKSPIFYSKHISEKANQLDYNEKLNKAKTAYQKFLQFYEKSYSEQDKKKRELYADACLKWMKEEAVSIECWIRLGGINSKLLKNERTLIEEINKKYFHYEIGKNGETFTVKTKHDRLVAYISILEINVYSASCVAREQREFIHQKHLDELHFNATSQLSELQAYKNFLDNRSGTGFRPDSPIKFNLSEKGISREQFLDNYIFEYANHFQISPTSILLENCIVCVRWNDGKLVLLYYESPY